MMMTMKCMALQTNNGRVLANQQHLGHSLSLCDTSIDDTCPIKPKSQQVTNYCRRVE